MIVYLSGPITGAADYESDFRNAQAIVESMAGVSSVINPVDIGNALISEFRSFDNRSGPEWVDFMRADIKALCDCDSIYMLDGWRNSTGSILEHQIAKALMFNFLGRV